jgi:sugar lactone lactonase YvrE
MPSYLEFTRRRVNARHFPTVVILVLAAFFPVYGQDAIAQNQAAAIASLQEINAAEASFATTYMRGFTSTLGALGGRTAKQPKYSAAGLIDDDLANGSKNGYVFKYSTEISDGRPSTYAVTASPANGSGNGAFYFTDQSGVIRQNSTTNATAKDAPISSAVIKLDPAFDEIVPADVHVELLEDLGVTQGALTEGPVWVRKGGYLLFSEVAGNVIYKWAPDGNLSVFLKPAGYTGHGPAASKLTHNGRALVHLIGSVGMTLDPQGRVVFSAQGDRAIVRLEPDGTRTILVDRFEGKRLNSTNDLVYKSDGALYFTDPNSGLQRGDADPLKELPFQAIFLFKDGKVQKLDFHGRPNGLALSPDEKYFYAIDSTKNTIMRFKILPDDTIADGQLFVDMSADHLTPDGKDRGGPDGMKVDVKGNVYSSGPDGIWVMSPEGKHLGTIITPTRITNPAFGDTDGKMLYLTTHTGELYRVHLNIEGVHP